LIDAIGCLRTQGVPLTVAIAGDGPLREALVERAAALGVSDRVRLLGHRTDVEQVYAAGDVFVLSSESEGLSNTILEAMASGLPVVATRVGGADEMVQYGVTGYLVPSRSPERLAAALKSVIGDRAAGRAMGMAGRARAEAEFSLRSMVRRYETMYVELAGAGRSASTVDASFAADVSRPGAV
jgi:glycosyltransferase involved in cell wall biosynthesis